MVRRHAAPSSLSRPRTPSCPQQLAAAQDMLMETAIDAVTCMRESTRFRLNATRGAPRSSGLQVRSAASELIGGSSTRACFRSRPSPARVPR